MRLGVKAFALTCGVIRGGLFVLTWWLIAFEEIMGDLTLIGRVYRGHTITPIGSIIGLIWAFFDGCIGGAIFAWLYNLFMARFSSKEVA